MFNGYRHDNPDGYAPETALGTGAAEPLVDEYEAAEKVPTVDEHTLDGTKRRSGNKPRPGEDDIAVSGDEVAEPTSEARSTGEDYETREVAEEPHADDAEVNKPAAEVRPEAPQAVKASRKKRDTV